MTIPVTSTGSPAFPARRAPSGPLAPVEQRPLQPLARGAEAPAVIAPQGPGPLVPSTYTMPKIGNVGAPPLVETERAADPAAPLRVLSAYAAVASYT